MFLSDILSSNEMGMLKYQIRTLNYEVPKNLIGSFNNQPPLLSYETLIQMRNNDEL